MLSILLNFHQSDIFRTIDGKCNNLKNPLWGSKTISMRRILPSISDLYKTDQYYSLDLGKIVIYSNLKRNCVNISTGYIICLIICKFCLFLVGLPCEDDNRFARFCPGWKEKCKGTQSYFMSKYCRKTCEECGGSKLTLVTFFSR